MTKRESQIDSRIAEIVKAPVAAKWEDYDSFQDLSLTLPHGNFFSAEWGHGDNYCCVGVLYTNPELRQHGIATRLVSSLAYLGIKYGLATINGTVESQHVVRIFRKLFGEDAVGFYEQRPRIVELQPLPITMDQAVSSLELAAQHERDLEYRMLGLHFSIDLASVRQDRLEVPHELNRKTVIE